MKLRLRSIVSASEDIGHSPWVPALAVLLITLFAWSLAQAAAVDRSELVPRPGPVLSAGNIAVKAIAVDYTSDREAATFSAPGTAPQIDSFRPYKNNRPRETN